MVYDARQVANWFIDRAAIDGRSLSVMSILKLSYIAHGWFLEIRNAPLFHNRIEAWKYGPVITDVYNEFNDQKPVVTVRSKVRAMEEISKEDENILHQIWNIYGGMSPKHLSDLTHENGGPWDIATQAGGFYAPIPNELIRQHYVLKRHKENSKAS